MPILKQDVELSVSARAFWMALKDAEGLPKVVPQVVGSITHVEGVEGQPGAVRIVKFGTSAPEGAYVKEKLTFIDDATFTCTTEAVEGGHLLGGFTKWSSTMKFIPLTDSTCKLAAAIDYETAPDKNANALVEHARETFVKTFSGLAALLQASGVYGNA